MISCSLEIPAQVVPARISAISESLTASVSCAVSVCVSAAVVVAVVSFLSATTFLVDPPHPAREIHITAAIATAVPFFILLIIFLILSPPFPFH